MSVAVCLSGHLGTFEKTAASFMERIVAPHLCDVFVSVWDRGVVTDAETIKKLYNPKSYELVSVDIVNFKDLAATFQHCGQAASIMYRLELDLQDLYLVNRACNLKLQYERDNGIRYDHTIRFRPDLYCTEQYSCGWPDKQIFVPDIGQSFFDGINSDVAIGSSDCMDQYSQCFDALTGYAVPAQSSEALLKHHLTVNNITYSKRRIPYGMIRQDGSYVQQTLER